MKATVGYKLILPIARGGGQGKGGDGLRGTESAGLCATGRADPSTCGPAAAMPMEGEGAGEGGRTLKRDPAGRKRYRTNEGSPSAARWSG